MVAGFKRMKPLGDVGINQNSADSQQLRIAHEAFRAAQMRLTNCLYAPYSLGRDGCAVHHG